MSFAVCIERLRAGMASIEFIEEDLELVEGEKRYMVRVQFNGVGHVLTNLTEKQLEDLKAARP